MSQEKQEKTDSMPAAARRPEPALTILSSLLLAIGFVAFLEHPALGLIFLVLGGAILGWIVKQGGLARLLALCFAYFGVAIGAGMEAANRRSVPLIVLAAGGLLMAGRWFARYRQEKTAQPATSAEAEG